MSDFDNKVRLLDRTVSERIAAGEVVDRPASVIKELVENSLDASASRIHVDIRGGGIEYMRVSDDGCGMSCEDVQLAVQRFATSKISRWEDLDSLLSLGFRGEALPSVGAVSRLEIRTCRRQELQGTLLTMEGAGPATVKADAAVPGTRITVRDLFFNTPARRKFLRAAPAESAQIIDLLGRLAAAYPEVNFRLTSNEKEVFSFPVGLSSAQRLAKLWKLPAADFLPVFGQAEGITLDGCIALPDHSRTNRNCQLFVMNGRLIRSQNLSQALFEGFSPLVERGRFPVAMIRLTVEPSLVDVNVHPTKMEVRFADPRPVFSVVYRAVAEALEAYHADSVHMQDFPDGQEANSGKSDSKKTSFDQLAGPVWSSPSPKGATFSKPFTTVKSSRQALALLSTSIQPTLFVNSSPQSEASHHPQIEAPFQVQANSGGLERKSSDDPEPEGENSRGSKCESSLVQIQAEAGLLDNSLAPESEATSVPLGEHSGVNSSSSAAGAATRIFHLFGQVHKTYIVGTVDGELWVIDQHTAHERINYENFSHLQPLSGASQGLLIPETIILTPAAGEFLSQNLEIFSQYGYEVEPFGGNSFRLRGVPVGLSADRTVATFKELVEEAASGEVSVRGSVQESLREKIRALASCKASVRAGDELTDEEMQHLVEEMLQTEHSLYCPHGRPTRIALDQKLLERLFHRT